MNNLYTINNYLDKLTTQYEWSYILEDEFLYKLFTRLKELKISLGGNTIINPIGEIQKLINTYLT